MGASFTNLTVCGPDRGDVVDCLNELGNDALWATVNGWTDCGEESNFSTSTCALLAERLRKLGATLSVRFMNETYFSAGLYAGTFVESYSLTATAQRIFQNS